MTCKDTYCLGLIRENDLMVFSVHQEIFFSLVGLGNIDCDLISREAAAFDFDISRLWKLNM